MPVDLSQEPPFGQIAREMSRFLDRMSKNYSNFYPGEAWHPNVNLYETEASYLVCVDLAGVDKEKIDLIVADGRLTLKGTRLVPTCPEISTEAEQQRRVRVHVMEIDHGSFCRVVEIPNDVHQERIDARYDDGLLWIHLPKK